MSKLKLYVSLGNTIKKSKLFSVSLFVAGCAFSGISQAEIHTIDLLILHPPKSVLNTDIPTRVASMEKYANKALENSDAKIRFRIVKIEEIDFPNPKTDAQTLNLVRKSKKVRELRAKYGADLVTMITPIGPYCGVGYVLGGYNGKIYSGNKNLGFNVVADRCITSFAHELGHNLGLGHSHKQGSRGGLYDWGRGYGKQHEFVTTMAYTSAYGAGRVQAFSNPDITFCKGSACGQPIEQEGGAHAVKAIGVSGQQIAAWFDSKEIVEDINQAPTATEDFAITRTNEAVDIAVLENDVDPEQDTLAVDLVGNAKHGETEIVNGLVKYTPDQSFVGQDKFQYVINDGHGHRTSTVVSINVGWGINYQYFQGDWEQLPDFNDQSVIEEGISHNFSLEKRLKDNNFGFRYFAQIEVPETGDYNFFLTSKDGSKLLIDDDVVIDNDGIHESITKNDSVYLNAGLHRIEVQFFKKTGDPRLSVEWQGPEFKRQIILSNALRLAEPNNSFPVADDDLARVEPGGQVTIDVLKNDIDTDGDEIQLISFGVAEYGRVSIVDNKLLYQPDTGFSGADHFDYVISDGRGGKDSGQVTVQVGQSVTYEYYEGNWNSLPDFDSLTPVTSGTQRNFSLINRNRDDNFAFRFRSGLDVPRDGRYYIILNSDDGSKIFIDGKLVVNNDGLHARRWKYNRIELTAGIHEVEVQYFEKVGRERLLIYWWERNLGFKKMTGKHLKAID